MTLHYQVYYGKYTKLRGLQISALLRLTRPNAGWTDFALFILQWHVETTIEVHSLDFASIPLYQTANAIPERAPVTQYKNHGGHQR